MTTDHQTTTDPEPPKSQPWFVPAAVVGLILLAVATYSNSFDVPFLWDDHDSIVENKFLEEESLWDAMEAPPRSPISGRPLVALSLAVNYKLGEREPFGYHLFNLAFHIVAGLLLFDLMRLLLRRIDSVVRQRANGLAALVAALWLAHPVSTEAVTYTTQRTELLASLFLLATLWAQARSWESSLRWLWFGLAIAFCLLGMFSKEIMVSAPLLVILLDRAFYTSSFQNAMRERWPLYVGVALTWIPLFVLVSEGARTRSVGIDMGLSPFEYAVRQCGVIAEYLRVSFVPTGLCFDYGENYQPGALRITLGALAILGLAAGTWIAWRKQTRTWMAAGFAGCLFFFVLAPTSSVLPIVSEIAAERRMYLPLAALVAVTVIGVFQLRPQQWKTSAGLGLLLVLLFSGLAFARNRDYASEELIWLDTLEKAPDNVRAMQNLGVLEYRKGNFEGAFESFEKVLAIDPDHPHAQVGVGSLLVEFGRHNEAIPYLERALKTIPDHAVAMNSLSVAYLELRQTDRAIQTLEAAVRIRAHDAETWNSLGAAYSNAAQSATNVAEKTNYLRKAIAKLERAVALNDRYAEAYGNLGRAYLKAGDTETAKRHLERACELNPSLVKSKRSLAEVRFRVGDYEGARALYQELVAALPRNADLRVSLGSTLVRLEQRQLAVEQYEQAIEINGAHKQALRFAGILHKDAGNLKRAREVFTRLVTLDPRHESAHLALAQIFEQLGDDERKKYHANQVLKINRNNPEAKRLLGGS